MPFQDNNTVFGIPAEDDFQVGISNVDPAPIGAAENGFLLPFPADPEYSWIYYECTVSAVLDSGIVVHNRLPQVDNAPDTLGACDYADPNFPKLTTGGVNLQSRDQYTDIVQRMGHARYWFRLWGKALRIGLQVPIPRLVTIGGVPAVPYDKNPQFAFNRIAPKGSYGSGLIMWHAEWSLWYTTAVPPQTNDIPAAEPSIQVNRDTPKPSGIQVPYSGPDDDTVKFAPPGGAAGGNFGGFI